MYVICNLLTGVRQRNVLQCVPLPCINQVHNIKFLVYSSPLCWRHTFQLLMYINSQNTAVRSSISYYSFRYFIVVSFRLHVSAHSFGPSSGLTNILEFTTVCNAYTAYVMI